MKRLSLGAFWPGAGTMHFVRPRFSDVILPEIGGSRAVWENAVALYRPATVAA